MKSLYDTADKGSGQPKCPSLTYVPSLWTSAISGSLGGGLVDGLLYPLDVLKTRLQAKEGQLARFALERSVVSPCHTVSFWRQWYPGLLPALSGSLFGYAIYFGTYSTSKRWFLDRLDWMHPSMVHLISGGLAEVTASIIYVPSEVLKTRLILAPPSSRLGALLGKIYIEGGLGAYFKGYSVTLCRDIPYSALQFAIYELAKKKLTDMSLPSDTFGKRPAGLPWCEAAAGVMAGAVAGWVTTPLDYIKTRIQGGLALQGIIGAGEQQRGKVKRLFRGALPRALASGLHTGTLFFMFECVLGVID